MVGEASIMVEGAMKIPADCPECGAEVTVELRGNRREFEITEIDTKCGCEQDDAWMDTLTEAVLEEATENDRDRYDREMDARVDRERDRER
jgi:hypothetical protein